MSEENKHHPEPVHPTASIASSPEPVEKGVSEGFKSPQQLVLKPEFEKFQNWMEKRLSNTDYIMGVIVTVLFVGFLGLLGAVIAIVIQVWGFNLNAQREMVNAIDKQDKTVEEFNLGVGELTTQVRELKTLFNPTPLPVSTQPK